MQIGYEDYSEDEMNTGCCLNCDDSELGCLCYDCKCKACFQYSKLEYTEYEDKEAEGCCDISVAAKIKAKETRKKISEWASKDTIDYTKIGIDKNQKKLV